MRRRPRVVEGERGENIQARSEPVFAAQNALFTAPVSPVN
jgi:hypothetical protein